MSELNIIACVSEDGGLGYKGELLWRLYEDRVFFSNVTSGKHVIMGHNTFTSIGRPLMRRHNIVLAHTDPGDTGVEWVKSMDALKKRIKSISDRQDIFIIGGVSLYNEFIDEADNIYLTEVEGKRQADVYFPKFDKTKYDKATILTGVQDYTPYAINVYRRKK